MTPSAAARTSPPTATADTEIRALTRADAHWHLAGLCDLLRDGVDAGACLGFLAPLTATLAARDWDAVQDALSDDARLWIALEGARVVGSVRLLGEATAGARHRALLDRLVVHSTRRGRGVATRLLAALEQEAMTMERTLLVADVATGSAAASMLERRGWTASGAVPGYVLAPDGSPRDGLRLYRRLGSERG